jgi:prophage regulatory protein
MAKPMQGFIVPSHASPNTRIRAATQPLHVIHIADAFLKLQTVIAVTGLSESTLRRKIAGGEFPAPIKDGTRCTRWVAGTITNWLHVKAAAK